MKIYPSKTFVLFMASLFFVSAQANNHTHNMNGPSMAALNKSFGKTFDIYWMSQMIEHHKGAIEMAESVKANGKRPEVLKAANAIVNAQSREVKTLTSWLKSWYNTAPNQAQMKLMRTDMQPMLEISGNSMPGMNMSENPDKAFLEGMIPHHQSAVDMAKLALKKALRPELKTFAKNVIADQSKEINEYQTWLKNWK